MVEEVAPAIKQTLATERARSELATRHDKIEDERAAGLRLTEVAQKLNLKAVTIEAVDRQGRDPAGKPVTGLPTGADVISAAFGSDVGVENEPVQLQGGGYLWFEVLKVTPSREQKLDDVNPERLYFFRTVKVIKSETLVTYVQELQQAPSLEAAEAGWVVPVADLVELGSDPRLVIPEPPTDDSGCGPWTLDPGVSYSC